MSEVSQLIAGRIRMRKTRRRLVSLRRVLLLMRLQGRSCCSYNVESSIDFLLCEPSYRVQRWTFPMFLLKARLSKGLSVPPSARQ